MRNTELFVYPRVCECCAALWHEMSEQSRYVTWANFIFCDHFSLFRSFGSGSVGTKQRKKQLIHTVCTVRISAMYRFQFPFSSHTLRKAHSLSTYFAFFFQISFAHCYLYTCLIDSWLNSIHISHTRRFSVCVVFLCKLTRSEQSAHLRSVVSFLFPFLLIVLRFLQCVRSPIAVCGTFRTLASILIRSLIFFSSASI